MKPLFYLLPILFFLAHSQIEAQCVIINSDGTITHVTDMGGGMSVAVSSDGKVSQITNFGHISNITHSDGTVSTVINNGPISTISHSNGTQSTILNNGPTSTIINSDGTHSTTTNLNCCASQPIFGTTIQTTQIQSESTLTKEEPAPPVTKVEPVVKKKKSKRSRKAAKQH